MRAVSRRLFEADRLGYRGQRLLGLASGSPTLEYYSGTCALLVLLSLRPNLDLRSPQSLNAIRHDCKIDITFFAVVSRK